MENNLEIYSVAVAVAVANRRFCSNMIIAFVHWK